MRVLLRSLQTGHFYAAPDQWTALRQEAADFMRVDAAMDQARLEQLMQMEVLMDFDGSGFEIPLRIVEAEALEYSPKQLQ